MILTAHQPAYLPWLGLFHKIIISDIYVYLDNVQFEKNSFTNRNKVRTVNGPVWLTVPVLLKNHMNKTIKEIEINNSVNWRKKHWRSIYFAYKKTPYFTKYSDFFEDVYKKEWHYLVDLNEYMLKWFLRELGTKVNYYKASELNFEGYKSELVLDMCKKLGADLYIFGALGKNYAKEEEFAQEGIRIYFQDYTHPVYRQIGQDFIPYMSIIDLLFNCGPDSYEILMRGNIIKEELIKRFNIK